MKMQNNLSGPTCEIITQVFVCVCFFPSKVKHKCAHSHQPILHQAGLMIFAYPIMVHFHLESTVFTSHKKFEDPFKVGILL